ncbi:MAG: biopolymer transporter ExbD [Pseudotabrizicola sp.]|uniref:ExbD/TolR family protein n=1 Tax=Pseudotabrizicola sp. TaxID=2939647 RepID=UPI002717D455|nr:biopolymer transporter ExbD [Pseudotabrizicola sp.]MDO9637837.1 biopolymer transporter ExbD [Pseudotabrizicola sp.]
MDFSPPPRRPAQENLLPMINVVFLLLIFFLISARLTPPEPFTVTPPEALAEAEAQGDFTLFISADGQLGYRDLLDDPALAAIEAARTDHCTATDCDAEPPRLTLRADTALPAARLAQILPRLSPLGFAQIELVAQPGATP